MPVLSVVGLTRNCSPAHSLLYRIRFQCSFHPRAKQHYSYYSTGTSESASTRSSDSSSSPLPTHRQQHLANLKVDHAQFLATASLRERWQDHASEESELEGVSEGRGKLLPTSSHLFKLILPLSFKLTDKEGTSKDKRALVPTVLLLHPAQPLMHVAQLIRASIQPSSNSMTISFRSSSTSGVKSSDNVDNKRLDVPQLEWADSTNVGDFIRDAARATEFSIYIEEEGESESEKKTKLISVRVPTFADRTRFLRRRLELVESQLKSMEKLKTECDKEAKRGARRMAVGGFGLLVVYWGAVARLTFWDYGWDVMEPITYLSGLSTVICGYLWFLYHNREVSYSSVLDRSVSTRQHALYRSKGLDIEQWSGLQREKQSLRNEIGKIKEDYEGSQSEKENGDKEEQKQRDKEEEKERKDGEDESESGSRSTSSEVGGRRGS
ncbi:hypothetical protein K435DRAFT_711819 [Dendrothele bispora CBS 962.96]|uniref:Calcium uniporter protein, mitochondrial n=1 Tax=Dendrothele bispora (strain CBS 962.96) TaxID=1314807 RepID=A0A4S8MSU8_DENBC|nr:hypothetical protein K435DRAFT_711819 [Dendrothele bispora CBS 962.96]